MLRIVKIIVVNVIAYISITSQMNAQTNIGMGVSSSLKAISLDLQVDIRDKVGLQLGASIPYKYGYVGDNYSSVIGDREFYGHIYETGETVDFVPYLGMYFKKGKTSVGVRVGAVIYTGYQNRYTSTGILGVNGYYYIRTKPDTSPEPIVGLTISHLITNKFYIQGGFDTYNKAFLGVRLDF